MTEPIDTILYGRTSQDDRRRLTIENQQLALARWVATDGAVSRVAGEFWDEGVSGKVPFFERPGGKRVADAIQRAGGKPLTLAVLYTDRFARDTRSGLNVAEELSRNNALIVSVFEGIDQRRDRDPMVFQIRLVMAEAEWRRIRERTENGKARALERDGAPVNCAIRFGYRMGQRGEWIEDPCDGPVLRLIFNLAEEGRNQCAIARWLNSLPNVRPGRRYGQRKQAANRLLDKRDGEQWHAQTVGRILRNRGYTGFRKYANGEFPVPALVSAEQFERVQAILDGRAPRPPGTTDRVPAGFLSGLLDCGECGRKLYATARALFDEGGELGTSPARYRCGQGGTDRVRCRGKEVRCHSLDRLAWDVIEEYLDDPAEVLRRALQADQRAGDVAGRELGQVGTLEAELATIGQQVAEVWEMQARNGWPLSHVEDGIKRLHQRRDRIVLELESARAAARAARTDQESIREVSAALATVRTLAEAGRQSARIRWEVARLLIAGGTLTTHGAGRKREVSVQLAFKWGDLVTARETGAPQGKGAACDSTDRLSSVESHATTIPVVFTLGARTAAG